VLRTTAACALLGNCGLMVPAAAAEVPRLTHFALGNFSGDAPAEGMSAFGVEMRDMT
jgi:DNA mismatch repair ATPase MutS